MTTAADIMHTGATSIQATDTLQEAARLMRDQGVGSLPVSDPTDPDERMCGIITDRDIVVVCIAGGHDPSRTTAGDLCKGTPRWISEGADVDEVLHEMETNKIRRLPVVGADKRLVGMVSEVDLAHHLSEKRLARFVQRLYA